MSLNTALKTLDTEKAGLHVLSDEDIHLIHNQLMNMMRDIANACNEENISWALGGGNILGAVRHQGFIPWDDDIDITMTRGEFERFRKIFSSKLNSKYKLVVPGDEGYLFHFPKIYDTSVDYQEFHSKGIDMKGLSIDIFILDNAHNSKLNRFWQGTCCMVYRGIVSTLRVERSKDIYIRCSQYSEELRKSVNKRLFIAKFFHFRSMEKWLVKADKYFSKVDDDNSKYVVVANGAAKYFREIYERKKLCDLQLAHFETEEWPIPSDADYYLSKRYGKSYMEMPSKEKREKHVVLKYSVS